MRKINFLILVILAFGILKIDIVFAENIYKEYKIGDKITYNDMDFYVIENSVSTKDYVTVLKSEPLKTGEMSTLIDSTEVAKYVRDSNGYLSIPYSASDSCTSIGIVDGTAICKSDYNKSSIKQVVDVWKNANLNKTDLSKDDFGYEVRLLMFEELINNLGYTEGNLTPSDFGIVKTEDTPLWVSYQQKYFTMSICPGDKYYIYLVDDDGLRISSIANYSLVRPVVSLKKDAIDKYKKKTISDIIFEVGDIVEYNGMDFYVLKNSKQSDNSVTLLKAEPLTTSEMSSLINLTEIVNLVQQHRKYLSVPYFSGETCVTNGDISGCTNDFSLSLAKQILDVWSSSRLKQEDLASDSLGYKVRLITYDEYIENCEIEEHTTVSSVEKKIIPLYEWMVNSNYRYWTMTPSMDDYDDLYLVTSDGNIASNSVATYHMIRPVITLKKANYNEDVKVDKNNQIVSVPDTFLEKSVIVVIIGLLLTIFGTIIGYTVIKKKKFTKNK